ncbi:hypothetical protein B0H16DRAFT_1420667 [Mycena metata]|uniref:F-box domain-containing protein n=1 Tax=Mycena metata TaxID=1033252 RepID=A0AAD7N805_9AGAR|nr:hypothetical protein B0H16DRAFT_1420667 [Mycena metata]
MHPALRVPELLRLICLDIGGGNKFFPSGLQELAMLARTCTTISEHALDVLWADSPTILDLMECMPPDLWKKDGSVRRPILRNDWERPLKYMHRVRRLDCTNTFPKSIDVAALFEILRVSLPTPHLFPNLRHLCWHRGDSLSLLPLLLAPGITYIHLGTFTSTAHLTLLATLATRCPALTNVSIYQGKSGSNTQNAVNAVSSFACGLNHIQNLSLCTLDQSAFVHLANLPSLRSLTLRTCRVLTPITGEAAKFPVLDRLTLCSAPFVAVLAFICTLSNSSPLETFVVHLAAHPSAPYLMQLYAALNDHLRPSSLRNLSIITDSSASKPSPEFSGIPFATIRHLLYFPNLHTLKLCGPFGIDIDDSAVLSMARAWPELTSLALCATYLPRRKLHPTLLSLLYLAEHCPKLESLELAVDASAIPTIDAERYRGALQHKLQSWRVAGSLISSPLRVARFLSGLFTQLDLIWGVQQERAPPNGPAVSLEPLWTNVGVMINECYEMREEERLRAGGTRMRGVHGMRAVSEELD